MKTAFKTSFFRDVKKIPFALHAELDSVVINIENAQSLNDIPNLKKLKGYKTAYRVRINNYRLCFFLEDETITIARFLPRNEVYRMFP